MRFRKILACGITSSVLFVALATPKAEAFSLIEQTGFSIFAGAQTISAESGVSKEEAAGARNFIDNMGKRAVGFLSDATLDHEARKAEFRKLLEESFDMKTIGRFALGTYWRVATPKQRQEYLQLFNDMIVNVYSRRFESYEGQEFTVASFRSEGSKDVLVTSYIVPKGDPQVRVDWLVRYKDGRYKIVDVIVEGVSMSITQRSDFSSIIQRGGGKVDVLLGHLRNQGGQ